MLRYLNVLLLAYLLVSLTGCIRSELPSAEFKVIGGVAAPDGGAFFLNVEDQGRLYTLGRYKPLGMDYFVCASQYANTKIAKALRGKDREELIRVLEHWLKQHLSPTDFAKVQLKDIDRLPDFDHIDQEIWGVWKLYFECSTENNKATDN